MAVFALLVSAHSSISARKNSVSAKKNVNEAKRSANAAEESTKATQRNASAAEDQASIAATQARQAEESVEVAKEQNRDAMMPRVLVRPVKPDGEWRWGIREVTEKEPPAPYPDIGRVAARKLSDFECMSHEIFYVVPVKLYNDGDRAARIYARKLLHFYEGRHPTKDQVVGIPEFSHADDCYLLYPQQHAYLEIRPYRLVDDLAEQIESKGSKDYIFSKCQIDALPGADTLPMRSTVLTFRAHPISLTGTGESRRVYVQSSGFLDIIPDTHPQH